MTLNESPAVLSNVLGQAKLAALLSDEGVLNRPFYPLAPWPPMIVVPPTNVTLAAGKPATLHLLAAGDPPLAYQWQRHGTNLPAATETTLALHAVTAAQACPYRVVLRSATGAVTSPPATLRISTAAESWPPRLH